MWRGCFSRCPITRGYVRQVWYIIRKVFASREASWVGKIVCGRRLEEEEVGGLLEVQKAKEFWLGPFAYFKPNLQLQRLKRHVPKVSLMESILKASIINKLFPSVVLPCTHSTQFWHVTTANGSIWGFFFPNCPKDHPGASWRTCGHHLKLDKPPQ